MSLGTKASACMPELRSEICASFQLCTILSRAGTPTWGAERMSCVARDMSASLALTAEGLTMSSVSRGVETRRTCNPPGHRCQDLSTDQQQRLRGATAGRLHRTGYGQVHHHKARQAYRSADGNGDQAGRDDSAPRGCRLPGGPLFHIADVLRRSRCATDRHSPDVAAVGRYEGKSGARRKKGALDSAARGAQLRSLSRTPPTRFPHGAGLAHVCSPCSPLAQLFREIALSVLRTGSATPPATVQMRLVKGNVRQALGQPLLTILNLCLQILTGHQK